VVVVVVFFGPASSNRRRVESLKETGSCGMEMMRNVA
jgi:hypothetical protein